MLHSIFPHQLRQLGDVRSDAPRLVAGEQIGSRAPAGVTLEIDVGERLTVLVADDDKLSAPPGMGLR